MSPKSAYVNSDIFLDWLKNHFYPKKPPGTVLLIFDGHSSHTSNLETLQFAEEHDIILFCLPPHTTHMLQPLDRCFFKALKGNYYEACRYFIKNKPDRKLTRLNFGKLLGEAWGKSATVQNALSSFKATGIMPFNPHMIPDYAFLMNDLEPAERDQSIEYPRVNERQSSPQPGTSGLQNLQKNTPEKQVSTSDLTPGKILDAVSPVPVITPAIKKARRQISGVLSSDKCTKKAIANKSVQAKQQKQQAKKKKKIIDSSSESEEDCPIDDSEEGEDLEDFENECVGCNEDYRKTKKKEDWIQCIICKRWLHEGCTSFESICQVCGTNVSKKKQEGMVVHLS